MLESTCPCSAAHALVLCAASAGTLRGLELVEVGAFAAARGEKSGEAGGTEKVAEQAVGSGTQPRLESGKLPHAKGAPQEQPHRNALAATSSIAEEWALLPLLMLCPPSCPTPLGLACPGTAHPSPLHSPSLDAVAWPVLAANHVDWVLLQQLAGEGK